MDYQILGPLEVRRESDVVALGGSKPRAILAVLLLNKNEPVSAGRLATDVWGEEAAAGTLQNVQVTVSRLRKALGDDIVTTTKAGYRLRVRPGELDADRFEQLVAQGRGALEAGQPEEAAEVLREAVGMWTGPPLADLSDVPFAGSEIARLEETRLAAIEYRVAADAAAGNHAELVPELRTLVGKHPARERFAEFLMLALYRCGRQSEALETYQRTRRYLTEEIGIEPGPELRALQDAILHQDPALKLVRLPHELAAAALSPLVGRTRELRTLLEQWEAAERGAGGLLTIAGAPGMGKTRLAAEVAVEAHRGGATIAYVSGGSPPAYVLRALGRVRGATQATLLVIDDVDEAGADVVTVTATLADVLANVPALVIATGTAREQLALMRPTSELTLEPLALETIRAIATAYVPDNAVDEATAEALLGASGGVPRRAHDLAGRWQATRRVEATAERAAVGRAALRTVEDDLVGSVAELQTAYEHAEHHDDDGRDAICPFKGLASFQAADAQYFCGRDRLVSELVAQLVGAPLLAVIGPSGSGKSSVVRAGLLPALAHGMLPGSDEWQRRVIRPGEHPSVELERALEHVDARAPLVLAVDQFEETFTACRDEEERARFVGELVELSEDREGSVVIVALRADFYGRCAAYPKLSRLLAANQVLVGPMRRGELKRAIVQPAERVGLDVEPDLVEALVGDVENEPGALPLLSTALLELWQRRDGRCLRLVAYDQTGGVHGAVARLAEDAFGRLDERQQALARTVLLRLAEVEPEGGVERRRLPLKELAREDDGDEVGAVIGLLADARLLTISAGAVEFAHEALLREWPRLREWIEDDREDLKVHRNLSHAAQEWERLGRDEGALYRGARLAEGSEWAERGDPGPTEAEREFLAASQARRDRERATRRRYFRFIVGGLLLAVAAISAVAIIALAQGREAERQGDLALSRQLALQSGRSLNVDPELGVRLALWALDTAPTNEAATALREATNAFDQLAVLDADSLTANAAAYSHDGRRIVTGGTDGVARVWDATTHRPVARFEAGHGALLAARYAPGGERIVLGFEDGTVLMTDSSLAAPRTVLEVSGQRVESVAISGDGRRIAAGVEDGTVRVLSADGGAAPLKLSGHDGPVLGVDMDRDGSRVVSAGDDGAVLLWNSVAGQPVQLLPARGVPAQDVDFSPDGSRILSVGYDGRVRLWNADSGETETHFSGGSEQLEAAAFSADGRRFAAVGRDGVVRVWGVDGGPTPVAVLRGQQSRGTDIGFGATSDRVVSAGDDGTVRIWDAGQTQAWTVPGFVLNLDFNRNGRLLATSSQDGTVRVWDAATGRMETSMRGAGGYVAAKFSPRTDTLAIPSDAASRVRLWPISEKSVDTIVQRPAGSGMFSSRFDATGERIVYVDQTGRVAVRDLASGREVTLGGTPKTVYEAQFSPDGNRVAAIPESGDVLVWRLDNPARPERVLKGHHGDVNTFSYGPGGRIVTGGTDRTIRVWDPRSGQALVLRGHDDELTTVLFTPDARRVLSSSRDGTVRLWDARTGAALAVLESDQGEIYDFAVSRDGKFATLGTGEALHVFTCDVCGSLEQVRALALSRHPRQLTEEERQQFLAAAD
jgi:WD40 repeat protein/DNA-binding SARP family transcriptional activator